MLQGFFFSRLGPISKPKIQWPNLRLLVILQTRVITRVFLRKIWLWHVMTGTRCTHLQYLTMQQDEPWNISRSIKYIPILVPGKSIDDRSSSERVPKRDISHPSLCQLKAQQWQLRSSLSDTVRSLTHRSLGLKYRIWEKRLWEEQEEFWRETLTFKVSLIIGDHLEASNSFVARRRWRNDCHLGGGPRGAIARGSSGWKHDLSLRVPVPVLLSRLWIVVVYLLNVN